MFGTKSVLALALLGGLLAAPATAETVNIYQIGQSGSPALDPLNNLLAGTSTISWNHNVASIAGSYILSILAEGVDGGPNAPGGGEHDKVYFNNTYIGDLTQQSFYSSAFNLQPGAGALAGFTALTLSIFDVTALVLLGGNSVRVDVDPANWVNEIETSDLSSVPLPAALPLLAGALGALGAAGARRKRKMAAA